MMLDSSTLVNLSSSSWSLLFVIVDCDRLNHPLRLRTREVNGQQPIFQIGTQHLHSISQYECALELTRGNSAVEVLARLFVVLPTADDELTFLDRHVEFVAGEPRDRQRNAQPFGPPISTRHPLDIVRRGTLSRPLPTAERPVSFFATPEENSP